MIENIENEVWLDIPDFPGFQVSNFKRVRKLPQKMCKKIIILKSRGRNVIALNYRLLKDGKRVNYTIKLENIENLQNEIWKKIQYEYDQCDGYYQVSNYGRVKFLEKTLNESIIIENILKQRLRGG